MVLTDGLYEIAGPVLVTADSVAADDLWITVVKGEICDRIVYML